MEAMLECSICMNSFDCSTLRTPKMLPCQHSFCFECLTRMYKSTGIACPTCRKFYTISTIENVPNNFILLQLLDVWTRRCKDSGDKSSCQKCRKNNKKISKHCKDCLDALIGNEVAQVIELMQGSGDYKWTTSKKDTPEVIPKRRRSPGKDNQQNSDLYNFMHTITILLVAFSFVVIICFSSSPFFTYFRLRLCEIFFSVFHQLSSLLRWIASSCLESFPYVINTVTNVLAIVFRNLIECLSVIGQLISDVSPFIVLALSQVAMFLVDVSVFFLKISQQLCIIVVSAVGNAFMSIML